MTPCFEDPVCFGNNFGFQSFHPIEFTLFFLSLSAIGCIGFFGIRKLLERRFYTGVKHDT